MSAATASTDSASGGDKGATTPKDPRVSAAEVERDVAKLELERRQSEKSLRELDAPTLDLAAIPKLTPKTATLSDKGGGASVTLHAANAVATHATAIATSVADATFADELIVIVDERNVSDLTSTATDLKERIETLAGLLNRAMTGQRSIAEATVEEADQEAETPADEPETNGVAAAAPEPAATPSVSPPAQVLGMALGLLDALTPSIGLSGRDADLPDQALRDAVAGKLTGPGKPAVIVPAMVSAEDSAVYDSVRDLALNLEGARQRIRAAHYANAPKDTLIGEIAASIAKADAKRLEAIAAGEDEIAGRLATEMKKQDSRRADLVKDRSYARNAALIADLGGVVVAADTFLAAILSRTDGPSLLQRVAVAEKVLMTNRDKRRFLHLDITALGGDVLTSESPLGAEMKIMGMAQTTFVLTDADGRVKAAGTHQGMDGDALKIERRIWERLGLIFAVGVALVVGIVLIAIVLRLFGVVV